MISQTRRFRTEWIVLIAVQLVVGALLVGTLLRERASERVQEEQRLGAQTRVIDDNLVRQLEGAQKALTGIGAGLREIDHAFNETAVTERLKLLTSAMPGVSSMLVLDAQGTIVASTRDGLTGKNFRQREYFDAPRRGTDPSKLYVSPPFTSALGTYVVVLSQAITNLQGRFVGVVTATLDPDYFNVLLRSVLYAPDMRTTLVHADGKVFLTVPADAGPTDPDSPRLTATRTMTRADLPLDKPLVVTVSRDLSALFAPWRARAWQLAASLIALIAVSSLCLWLNHRRRSAVTAIEEAVARERQIGLDRVDLALRGADLGLWDLHVPTDRFIINARERELLGYGNDAPLPQGATWRQLIHPDDRALVDAAILPHLRGEAANYECEHRMRHRDGHYLWLSNRAMIVERTADGAPLRIVGTHLDITARRAAERDLARSEERLSLALEGSGLALFDWDLVADTVYHSAQAAVLRHDVPEATTTSAHEQQRFVHPDDIAAMLAQMKRALVGETALYHAEFRLRRTDGEWVWIRARGRVVQRDAAGRAVRLAGTYADIHDRKIAEGRLRRLAEFDVLTGLPNRALFHDRLQQAMARASRGKPMALLFLDVDRFKMINDTLGHAAGDKLLKVYAVRMQGTVRESDTVARLAGDEFTIILEGLRDTADARMLAAKLVEALRQPIELEGRTLAVTASIGVTMCAPGESDDAALVRRADAALYEAKRRGRDGYWCADGELVAAMAPEAIVRSRQAVSEAPRP